VGCRLESSIPGFGRFVQRCFCDRSGRGCAILNSVVSSTLDAIFNVVIISTFDQIVTPEKCCRHKKEKFWKHGCAQEAQGISAFAAHA
jgi:hypothetical protein